MPTLLIKERGAQDRTVRFEKPSFSIGKREDNDLVLAMSNVSRRHCEIIFKGDRYFIRDLNSSNGTFVNGERVMDVAALEDGAVIQVGDFILVFGLRDSPSKTSEVEPVRVSKEPHVAAEARSTPRERGAGDVVSEKARRVIPVELKRKIHQRLLESKDIKRIDFESKRDEEARIRTRDIVIAIVKEMESDIPSWVRKEVLVKEILDEALGLGPLEDLLADESISEVMVNNWDRVYIERGGKLYLTDKQFTDNEQVINIIQRIISPLGRRIDESSPMVDARLKDGSRVNAIIAPLAVSGPTLTIRKFMKKKLQIEDLIRFGSLTRQMGEFLRICVQTRKNICISGGTGSGKTTLLNVLASFIGHDERIITIEDAAELKLPQEHVVSLEAKPPNIEGKGAIPIQKLVINALRMRPDRIVVGECRGGEAFDMLQAMNTGHDGSLTTIHANSPRDAIARLENLVLMAGMDLPARAIREQIASAINVIVQQARLSDGSRKITNITEVTGMESGVVTLQDIFVFEQTGFDKDRKVIGRFKPTGAIPKFFDELRKSGYALDMSIFNDEEEPCVSAKQFVMKGR